MANRVLSIEISQSITRVVEIDYKAKNPQIYNFFSFETPRNVLEDGSVKATDTFVSSFKAGLRNKGIKTNKVVFTITSGRIASREISVPLVKEKRIQSLVTANAQEYFPVELDKYQVKYMIVDKIDTPERKAYQLVVLAIPNDIIESYISLAEACGLTIETMDYVGNSVIEAVRKEVVEETVAVIKIDEEASLFTVFQNGKLAFQRSISYGIDEAIEQLRSTDVYGDNLSYTDAMNIMRRKCCIRRHLDVEADYREEEDTELTVTMARAAITEALRPLIENITRVLNFYHSRNRQAQISKILLIGLGADFSGLSKLLTNELQIKTLSLQQLDLVKFNRRIDNETFKVAEYMTCIGATINPINVHFASQEKEVKAKGDSSLMLASAVFGVCLVASVAMVAIPYIKEASLKKQITSLSNQKAELAYIEEVYNNYQAALNEYDAVSGMYVYTQTPNEQLISFIEEMEQKMPSDIKVVSFTANASGVNMNIKVSSKSSAAKVLVELRTFSSLAEVTTSGISEVTDEVGSSYVEFAVSCTYQQGTNSDETDTTEENTTELVQE